jgi:hypothetical protein
MNLLAVLVTKVVIATGLAGMAEVVRRRVAHPEAAYALWASVLAVLIMPSIFAVSLPEQFSAHVQSALGQLPDLFVAENGVGPVPGEGTAAAEGTGVVLSLLSRYV